MKKISGNAGWFVATVLATVMVTNGFQGASEKFGVVDMSRAIQQSDFGKKSAKNLEAAYKVRNEIFTFIQLNPLLTVEQAQNYRELKLKPEQTEADKKAIQKIIDDVKESMTKREELAHRAPTDSEMALLAEFAKRKQTMDQIQEKWRDEFNREYNRLEDEAARAASERARAALFEVSKGYTLVHDAAAVPYGANDLTDNVIKAMNAKK